MFAKFTLVILLAVLLSVTEVWLLLLAGETMGVAPTLYWVLATAILGLLTARLGGVRGVVRIHWRLKVQELPVLELLDLAMVLVSSVSLILPGFITDGLGLLLLFPPTRWFVRSVFSRWLAIFLPAQEIPGRDFSMEGEPLGGTAEE